MEAYQVLRDARSRAAYDAHLAQRRRESRRRFVHSAAVMVATFMLTTSSAVFLVGLQGISVHSQTWQIATAWLTSVEVEPRENAKGGALIAKVVTGPSSGKLDQAVTDVRPTPAPSKGQRKVASAASKTGPAVGDPVGQESWWSWPRF
jgi:hypothetical protein